MTDRMEISKWMDATESKIKELLAGKTNAEIKAYIHAEQNRILEVTQSKDPEEVKKLSIKLLKYRIHCMKECMQNERE